ncbi:related to RLR1-Subunit of the THO complex [Sporisorium reilianum f. sp. reilianum]|uniref:THO complex subunit 2 n=1 Tax=Sporisorium reilianum f. sp. reilianum TaxID=72559 RepID=A0A2N8UJP1_9BASI|nr:related to RLR1-Subunit of the THO complex [Sporisorium reilianum f. sp. reilianum]
MSSPPDHDPQAFVASCLADWSDHGASQLTTSLDEAITHADQHQDDSHLSALLIAALRLYCLTSCTPQDFTSQVFQHSSQDDRAQTLFSDSLLDSIWTFDTEIESRNDFISSQAQHTDAISISLDSQDPIPAPVARQRLADLVHQLISASILTASQAGERLEISLLALAGLIPNEVFFNKRFVQLRTARLFKQQKFNLLREENEGYTALITEIVTNLGPSVIPIRCQQTSPAASIFDGSTVTVVEQESPATRNRRAARVMNNVQALIGYFDLDANRVLDVILDLFATEVMRHYPFFLALLAESPWASSNAPSASASNGTTTHLFGGVDLDLSADSGDRICAQLLGFKFAHYCHADTKDSTPDELYFLAALLIKSGFVRFADLYPHLSPTDEGMNKLHAKHRQAMSAKVSSARANALSMAAPLTDDTDPASARKDLSKNATEAQPKEPPYQTVGLLRALLALGDLRHALFILTRYPWLCSAFDEIADPYIRLLNVIIQPAYDEISFSRMHPAFASVTVTTPKPRWDAKLQQAVPPTVKSLALTRKVPEPLPSLNCQQVFFYPHWADSLPSCRSLDDVLRIFLPLLKILGAPLWRDAALLQKLCRLTKVGFRLANAAAASNGATADDFDDFDEPQPDPESQVWFDVLRFHLLPALSLSPPNSGIVDEIWMLVRIMPYEKRFSLYGQWKNDLYQLPELRAAQASTEKEAKGILKRISKDNIKQSGRNLAKASHSNPTTFFTVALNQVQAYDNLIQPLVESAKYLSQFEYDIFSFNLVDALSNPEKERTKQDGTNISLWLKSLAAFCGTLFRRYAMMDCTPILQYLVNQLKANNSKDLVIMSELITKMSGIEPLANLADAQIAALTGGRHLHMEAMMAANALTGSKERLAYRRSGQRLLHALVESKLSVPLLILVAQQRQACIHLVPESEAHLKYLGNLYDSCQEVLLQYVEFLFNHLETADYASLVPSLQHLCVRFGIEPAMAFYIARPKLVHSMRQVEAAEAAERLRAELTASRAKAKAAEGDKAASEEGQQKDAEEGAQDGDVEMEDADTTKGHAKIVESSKDTPASDSNGVTAMQEDESSSQATQPWHKGLLDAIAAAKEMLPEAAHSSLGVHFYVTFWQLRLADINVPIERYQQEVKRLNALVRETTLEDQRKRLQDNVSQLNAEMKDQMKSHEVTRKRLMVEKEHWFSDSADRGAIVTQLIQYCLFPRALLSPTDAILAGKFIRTAHNLGTRNFSSLTAYDKIFVDHIAAVIFSSTENEARNYSRFLYTILADLTPWHRSSETYAKEAIGQKLPGFQMRWHDRHGGEDIPSADLLSWEQFRIIFCKWQDCLQRAFKSCLSSKEYMRIRNAIIVMTRISPFYPLIESNGTEISALVESLAANEQRGDLKILAQGLLATLKARKKSWIPLGRARTVPNAPAPAKASSAAGDAAKSSKETAASKKDAQKPKEEDKKQESANAKETANARTDAPPKKETPAAHTNGGRADKPSDKASTAAPAGPRASAASTGQSGRGGTATKVPPSANLPSRPGLASQNSAPAESKDRRSAAPTTSSASEPRRGGDDRSNAKTDDSSRRSGVVDRNQTAPPSGPRGDASRANGLPTRPPREPAPTNDRNRASNGGGDRRAPAQTARDANDKSSARPAGAGGEAMNPPSGPASTTGAQAARSRADRDRAERSSSASLAPAGKEKDVRDRDRDRSDRDRDRDKARIAERERERERERDRRDRDRSARDRDRERERDRERDRERERERDKELRDRDRARERERGGNARDRERDRDDRKRGGGSAQASRNGTPTREVVEGGRRSGSSTPLGPRRDREQSQQQPGQQQQRNRESAAATPTSARSTPGGGSSATADEITIRGGAEQQRKRTLVDRLGGSSSSAAPSPAGGASPSGRTAEPDPTAGWDTEESSKRIKIDRSQKYAATGPPVPSASASAAIPDGPRSEKRHGQGARSSFGGGGRRDGGRDQRRDRSARRAGNE